MKKNEPKKIFKHALAFESTADVLKSNWDILDSSLYISYFMNEAFSIELFFKAIINFENNNKKIPQTHDLDKLFKELSEESKKSIIEYFDSDVFDSDLNQIESMYNLTLTKDLVSLLEHYSNIFVKVRYLYESPLTYPILFLKQLRESVKKRCEELDF